jgi:hypothetical protein
MTCRNGVLFHTDRARNLGRSSVHLRRNASNNGHDCNTLTSIAPSIDLRFRRVSERFFGCVYFPGKVGAIDVPSDQILGFSLISLQNPNFMEWDKHA